VDRTSEKDSGRLDQTTEHAAVRLFQQDLAHEVGLPLAQQTFGTLIAVHYLCLSLDKFVLAQHLQVIALPKYASM
jgi:hypothetical protein